MPKKLKGKGKQSQPSTCKFVPADNLEEPKPGPSSLKSLNKEEGISTLIVKTKEGKQHHLAKHQVKQIGLLRMMTEALGDDEARTSDCEEVPLNTIRAEDLEIILRWTDHYKDEDMFLKGQDKKLEKHSNLRDVRHWDEELITSLTDSQLYSLMIACNFLDVKVLTDSCSKIIAFKMIGKSVEEVRDMFEEENDYDSEEEEEIKSKNAWAEDTSQAKLRFF